jgi:hypothetical protein
VRRVSGSAPSAKYELRVYGDVAPHKRAAATPGGEQVVEVLALTADQAASYIAEHDPVHADVFRLADAMG